ncbi:MAG: ImmA/IrrE family metallo-endopeptidase [Pseudomonadota bacterium]|nr:ImmA/IrrE family metallo-endopeptidase [Pseudomonadota bacterium]
MKVTAPYQSLENIRKRAWMLRLANGAKPGRYFDAMDALEKLDAGMVEEFNRHIWECVQIEDMPDSLGEVSLKERKILLREDCYLSATDGDKEGLFTVAHELGHFFLHTDCRLHRLLPDMELDETRCPEYQADAFACELLIDSDYLIRSIHRMTIDELSDRFRIPVNKLNDHLGRMAKNGDINQQLSLF